MSELTGQTIPVVMTISLLIKNIQLDIVCTKEMIFQQKLLEKAYCFVKMTGPAMVQPVGSDFWKAP